MRISDWSSDVCSSDLTLPLEPSRQSCKSVVDRIFFRHRASGRALRRLTLRCRLALRLVTRLIAIVLLLAGTATALDLDIHRLQAARERSVLRIIVAGETDGIALGVLDQFLIRERHRLHLIERKRSEEHTSELQSLMRISYAVFCLKKKKQNNNVNSEEGELIKTQIQEIRLHIRQSDKANIRTTTYNKSTREVAKT